MISILRVPYTVVVMYGVYSLDPHLSLLRRWRRLSPLIGLITIEHFSYVVLCFICSICACARFFRCRRYHFVFILSSPLPSSELVPFSTLFPILLLLVPYTDAVLRNIHSPPPSLPYTYINSYSDSLSLSYTHDKYTAAVWIILTT